MADTYPAGQGIVLGVVFVVLVVLNGLEFYCAVRNWPSIGHRVERWSSRNPWFVGVLLLALGTFLAHFFLNPLPPAG
jgi:cadmium resistance protein CadD (predicted permease)